ncbi:serine--tRNA ligase [Candidatus Woesearchaeota archaeon]|nr:serine--tRNA ligase [Candidatus Woesearchaeota archaeon]
MIDIKIIRESPNIIRQDLKKRKDIEKLKIVETILNLDKEKRALQTGIQELQHKQNEASKEINDLKKQGKDIKKLVLKIKAIPGKIQGIQEQITVLELKLKDALYQIPNILHDSVPYGKDDKENVVIRTFGKPKKPEFELLPHHQVVEKLMLADFDRARKITGAGFYFLKGDLALLNQALIRFTIDMMTKKGFMLVEPPLMMTRKAYEGVTDLHDFENVMYKIENHDAYLIATSEHPLTAMFMNEVLDEEDIPLKLVGISPCFRKEIGSHGIDEKGLFRVHQFQKVEQIIIGKPEQSWKMHEELLKNAEELFQELEIPYRVVNICTGDIGTVAAKKYDIEAWMPRTQEYKEVVSCSNCTEYQARRLNIKIGKQGGEKQFAHTLNSTAVATPRALVAILENYQNKDGSITVPKILVPYMNGKKVLK